MPRATPSPTYAVAMQYLEARALPTSGALPNFWQKPEDDEILLEICMSRARTEKAADELGEALLDAMLDAPLDVSLALAMALDTCFAAAQKAFTALEAQAEESADEALAA